MGFLLRFSSRVALMVAIAVAVVDSVRFVAGVPAFWAPLRAGWFDTGAPLAVEKAGSAGLAFLLDLPAVPFLFGLSLLLWVAGYRRPVSSIPYDVHPSVE